MTRRNGGTYRCPQCATDLGIIRKHAPGQHWFRSLPGSRFRQRDDGLFEIECRCGKIHRFVGTDYCHLFRIVQ